MHGTVSIDPVTERKATTPTPASDGGPLVLEEVRCCLCDEDDAEPIAVGADFEYHTSPDTFCAKRCRGCGLVFLDPRPAASELGRIYPPSYHAFAFSAERFGLVYRVRRRLEARRLLGWLAGVGEGARILDVGCGDGFHLGLLREFGDPSWSLTGVDSDPRAAAAAAHAGLSVYTGRLETLDLPRDHYDVAFLIQTIEHVGDPPGLLRTIRRHLRPGGRLVVVTDNTATSDFRLFEGRHWGGYHFPRHWNLFHAGTLALLARKAGYELAELGTQVSPVNWVYSVRNALVDWGAPAWLVERFSLRAPGALAAFTALDAVRAAAGRGALLRAVLRRPIDREEASCRRWPS